MSNRQIEIDAIDRIEELSYLPVSPKYKSVQITSACITYIILAGLALLLLLLGSPWWCIATEIGIVISFAVNLVILQKAYLFKGYALRENDISYRSGVIFPKITTVPLSRIQQVSINQNPISRFFNLCEIEIVNGAQVLMSLEISGLTRDRAEEIKSIIISKINDYE